MRVSDLVEAMEGIAPTRYAEAWDNVGLLVGDRGERVSKVLLAIDYTVEVAREGERLGCDAVVAYHPPIFQGVKRIEAGGVIHDAIRRGVAIYSPHTAWDVAEGGTNDVLARVMGLTGVRPLKPAEGRATRYKMVVFVPEKDVERVGEAMFRAGAGRIGNYSRCSFRSEGTGTFFGKEGTKPAVGEAGRLETADEIRVETVVTIANVERVIAAMRAAHPYEEPAFDLVQLAAVPEGKGIGRIGVTEGRVTREELCRRLKVGLGVKHLMVSGAGKGAVKSVAMCAGATWRSRRRRTCL
jgi:dinuclear metal center YbgI/SA1388 family protein